MPLSDDGRIDMYINNHRVQVKAVRRAGQGGYTNGSISVRKSGKRANGVKTYRYTILDVDFIVGVDTDTFDVYVIPIAYAEQFSATVGISKIVLEGYKNNLNLLV